MGRAFGALAGFGLCLGVMAQNVNVDQAQGKLRGDLAEVLRNAAVDELVPITVVMKDQAPRDAVMRARGIADKAQRREYVVNLLKGVAERSQGGLLQMLQAEAAQGNVERLNPMWIANVVGARVTPAVAHRIAQRDDVAWVNYDRPAGPEVFGLENWEGLRDGLKAGGDDGGIAAVECGTLLMRAPEVWNNLGITGNGVVVGVVDTGMCRTHPDIVNQVWTNPGEIPNNGIDDDNNGFVDDVYGWDFETNDSDPNDQWGHGSHVSGTVAGDGTQGTECGVAPDAKIMTLKFWNSFSGEQSVWDGMEYGVDNGADILTASLGWPHSLSPDRVTWRTVCENAMAAGVVVLYAAHNYGCSNPPDDVTTPGDVPDMITVGATDCNDFKASFSSCGPSTWQNIPPWFDFPYPPGKMKPTISAPGVDTVSHSLCTGYVPMSGTSMATPHVAGTVALMLEANPSLDHWQVKQILKDTAVDVGPVGPENQTGHGRVDAFEAVVAAMGAGGLSLTMGGSCPGPMTATVSGAGAGDLIGLAYSLHTGSTPVPQCPGLSVDLGAPVRLIGTENADANGEAVFNGRAVPGACGRAMLQAVDVTSCQKTNLVSL